MPDTPNATNESLWRRSLTARSYRNATDLFPAETAILQSMGDRLGRTAMLDIGIGAGRTTGHLASRCKSYVGIDYSKAMVERAKARFPDADLRFGDARDLGAFASSSLDLVLFSYNGMDYVGHDDRLRIQGEIRRVLKDGGLFAFSTHRLGVAIARPASLDNFAFSLNPARTALSAIGYLQGIRNSRTMRKREEHHGDYALLNDPAHEYRLLTYYISPQAQVRQLERAGFAVRCAFGMDGQAVYPPGIDGTRFGNNSMVHYLATAAPAG